jgi:hypothetical protein
LGEKEGVALTALEGGAEKMDDQEIRSCLTHFLPICAAMIVSRRDGLCWRIIRRSRCWKLFCATMKFGFRILSS